MKSSLLVVLLLAFPLIVLALVSLGVPALWSVSLLLLFVVPLVVGLVDITQKNHAILHNFPVIGHFRYLIEQVGPELRQYIVAKDEEELPFNRSERAWVYASAKGENNLSGFGTSEQLYSIGYPIIKNAALPFPESKTWHPEGNPSFLPCHRVIGEVRGRRRPFRPGSILNISAMSYGALGKNAISALNRGAALAGAYHNTGEGGLSPYHESGADVIWQLGTGYFGARREDGGLDLDRLVEVVSARPFVRAIEIKLSQGAKPGKGGVLPGAKVTADIARVRGIPVGRDCISPSGHSAFSDADSLLDLIETMAERTGLPVGVKAAIGETDFWREVAVRMRERGVGPDFFTVDGGEGGTGAAPLTFVDHVSLPFKIGFARVYRVFQEEGVSDRLVWIGSAKLGFPDRTLVALALGCDLVNVAREALLSIGCIQARKCHTDHCPSGIATHNPWLQKGLDVETKALRAARYIQTFRQELLSIAHAAGREHPCQVRGSDIEISVGSNRFATLEEVFGYSRDETRFESMRALGPAA